MRVRVPGGSRDSAPYTAFVQGQLGDRLRVTGTARGIGWEEHPSVSEVVPFEKAENHARPEEAAPDRDSKRHRGEDVRPLAKFFAKAAKKARKIDQVTVRSASVLVKDCVKGGEQSIARRNIASYDVQFQEDAALSASMTTGEFIEASVASLDGFIKALDYERQLARLKVFGDPAVWFPGLADADVSRVGVAFAKQLEPTVAKSGFELYRQDVVYGSYSTMKARSPAELSRGFNDNFAAVALNTRVKLGSELNAQCENLSQANDMSGICPKDVWRFGAPVGSGEGRDDRWFLVLGRSGAVTPTHVDPGVQAVFYHTVAGQNRVIGVPRPVASRILSVRRCLEDRGCESGVADAFEVRILERCAARRPKAPASPITPCPRVGLHRGLLEYAEIGAGETLLILPRGGHAVMTGESKVVVAGEWHQLT